MKKLLALIFAALFAVYPLSAQPYVTVADYTLQANKNLAFGVKANGDPIAFLLGATGILQTASSGGSGSGGSTWTSPPTVTVGGYSMPANGNMAAGVTSLGVVLPILCDDTGAVVISGGGGDVSLAGNNPFVGANSFAGITTFTGAIVGTYTAMPALAVNVAKWGNSYSATGDVTFTYSSATPTAGTTSRIRITADSTARTITIPTTWSLARAGNITSLLVPASTVLQVQIQYASSRWEIIGDPVLTSGSGAYALVTGASLTPSSVNITNAARPTLTLTTTGTTGLGRVSAQAANNVFISQNLSYDGSNWNRDDVTRGGSLMQIVSNTVSPNGAFVFYTVDLGSNPASLTNIGNISGTGLNAMAIGATTPASGLFTTLSASGAATFTTQSAADNSTKASTTAYTDRAALAGMVGTYASPDTTGGAVTLTYAVTEVWSNTTTTYVLPAVASSSGKAVVFYVVGSSVITIDPNASEIIVRDGTPQTGGVTMTLTGTAGNYVCLVCEGTRWITWGFKGTLAAGS